jgi:Kef-type K+ transport system membrane component KefB
LGALLEQLWEPALGTSFGALGQPLCRGASGTSFGEQVLGTALGSSFVNSFLHQIWGAAMIGAAFVAGLFQSETIYFVTDYAFMLL